MSQAASQDRRHCFNCCIKLHVLMGCMCEMGLLSLHLSFVHLLRHFADLVGRKMFLHHHGIGVMMHSVIYVHICKGVLVVAMVSWSLQRVIIQPTV